ncbi:MAG: hypothetical protein GY758_25925 [Fuerstiella sp.]|nr:hypothetical protein [Fuerstiella sp.]MCP4506642.1 hypothetical protein [Fuerstiella sp.]
MKDNRYNESEQRLRAQQPFGRMLVIGFLVLTGGLGLQGLAEYLHADFFTYVVTAPAGIKPSELAERIQLWVIMSAVASVVSLRLSGIGLLLPAIRKRLSTNS